MASGLAFNAFENYVADANESVKFKLVTCPEDLEEDFKTTDSSNSTATSSLSRIPAFKPEMTYAFFGENENIFGYKNLCVKIYYSCSKLNIYLGMTYSSVVTKDKTGGIEPDNVLKTISTKYETKVTDNLSEFSANLSKEKAFNPYGDVVKEFAIDYHSDNEQPRKRQFQLYKANNSVPGFVAYHDRMQTFLMWFIEAASYIDMDDERWDIFALYEKMPVNISHSGDSVPLEFQYCFVGYCSVYQYYAFPTNVRPRISQFLILPPFQRMGLGTKMLETIYTHYNVQTTVDIRVEDPSESFQIIRDILDCKLCQDLKAYSLDKLLEGWSSEMANEAKEKFKISDRQARRVYEILRLKATDRADETQYRTYRLMIKQRLNAPYQKQLRDLERVKPKVPESEYISLMKSTNIPREVRINLLTNQYEELESEYLNVIEKLA